MGLLLGACTRLPAEEARGGPAAAAASFGFAALSSHGVPLGSAVAVAPDRLLTNAHVLPEGLTTLQAQRGDAAVTVTALVLARSPALDLAVLRVSPGVFKPVPRQAAAPATGQRIWAIGAPSAGPALAEGVVEQPDAVLAGRGPGFIARIGALMGYSGGAALDAQGRLRGLVTAQLGAGSSPALAALTGLDPAVFSPSRDQRKVFVLSIDAAIRESNRIAPPGLP
ncbi:trypsin-like peptidase domain-containing protein [Roseomonas frigidaquae]|uniref:Trypsin-like peptidase domain-containing protein n=1 Tax=Falsiroseomonas frigidaquae TaxID=487318 RepID=A0ABX1F8N8_9PROT|nr:trypsin-like peptidase domain-containing protein [Falsiroseomonas frigidaquae]